MAKSLYPDQIIPDSIINNNKSAVLNVICPQCDNEIYRTDILQYYEGMDGKYYTPHIMGVNEECKKCTYEIIYEIKKQIIA